VPDSKPEALFLPDGDGFKATSASLGPWGPDMLHGGAVSALLVQLLEEQGGPGWVPSRFTCDLVRPVTTGHLDIEGRVVRQGKRINCWRRSCSPTASCRPAAPTCA
jgi:acyl-coenzyme A thioesterase PaaI-like protein